MTKDKYIQDARMVLERILPMFAYCPWCDHDRYGGEGHNPDCKLAALLKEVPE